MDESGNLFNEKLAEQPSLNSSLEEDEVERSSRHIQIYVLFTLAALAVIGNVLIIIRLCGKRLQERAFNNINFLIFQLAISDLLVAAFCLFADGVWKSTYQWLAGNLACKLVKFMQMFALYTSTFIIVTISLDRCVAVRFTLTKFSHNRLVKIMSLCAWILSAVCSIPQILIFRVLTAPFSINAGDFEQCVTFGAYVDEWQEPTYILFTFCAMFALPLLLITVSYTLIFIKIKRESGPQSVIKSANSSSGLSSYIRVEKRDLMMRRAKNKALCVSILVISTFLICWAPYYIAVLCLITINRPNSGNNQSDVYHIFQVIFFFGMSNSVLNPIIYGAFHLAHGSQSAWQRWNCQRCSHNSSIRTNGFTKLDSCTLVFNPLTHVALLTPAHKKPLQNLQCCSFHRSSVHRKSLFS